MKTIEEPVARVGDLKDGQMKQVQVDGTDVLLLRHEGQFYALGAECPHYHAPLAKGALCNGRVVCPWHASMFDATTGDLLEPPSLDALPKFSVRVEGDEIYVAVPRAVGKAADHAHVQVRAGGRSPVVRHHWHRRGCRSCGGGPSAKRVSRTNRHDRSRASMALRSA